MAHSAASIISPLELKKKKDPNYNLDRHPVGTGPYKFAEWKDGQYIKVVKNDQYWDKAHMPQVDSIVYKPITEASTRVNMLKTGELDIVKNLPTESANELKSNAKIDLNMSPSMDVFYIGMNHKLKKYNLYVRQAMNYALNKQQMIAQVENGFGRIADSAHYGVIQIFPITSESGREACHHKEVIEQIKACDGLFFCGGDQQLIADAFFEEEGSPTPAYHALEEIFHSGGCVAGTSAGAAIMSERMIGNAESWDLLANQAAPLAIRNGFGFFRWGMIDQHFHKRGRIGRLIEGLRQSIPHS